jgi:hypothetical protein
VITCGSAYKFATAAINWQQHFLIGGSNCKLLAGFKNCQQHLENINND